jgi:hypothetical protein
MKVYTFGIQSVGRKIYIVGLDYILHRKAVYNRIRIHRKAVCGSMSLCRKTVLLSEFCCFAYVFRLIYHKGKRILSVNHTCSLSLTVNVPGLNMN